MPITHDYEFINKFQLHVYALKDKQIYNQISKHSKQFVHVSEVDKKKEHTACNPNKIKRKI